MASLAEITDWLDQELRIAEIPDYSAAHNGLQFENGGEVTRVAAAVDASLPVIEKTIEAGADLLVVHHGLFWQGVRMMTGPVYRKFKMAIDAGLAIYSSHIPLDVHPEYGNNVLLAKALGLELSGTFLPWKGIELGVKAEFDGTLGELEEKLRKAVGHSAITRCGSAEQAAGTVGIITGGAGSEIENVAQAGITTFISGEGPHWSHPLAEELSINFLYSGHYATETFGVRRLVQCLETHFGLSSCFIDHPTGL